MKIVIDINEEFEQLNGNKRIRNNYSTTRPREMDRHDIPSMDYT